MTRWPPPNKSTPPCGTGRGAEFGLREGAIVRTGWRPALTDVLQSLFGRLAAAAIAAVLIIAGVGWLGFSGMAVSNDGLRHCV